MYAGPSDDMPAVLQVAGLGRAKQRMRRKYAGKRRGRSRFEWCPQLAGADYNYLGFADYTTLGRASWRKAVSKAWKKLRKIKPGRVLEREGVLPPPPVAPGEEPMAPIQAGGMGAGLALAAVAAFLLLRRR